MTIIDVTLDNATLVIRNGHLHPHPRFLAWLGVGIRLRRIRLLGGVFVVRVLFAALVFSNRWQSNQQRADACEGNDMYGFHTANTVSSPNATTEWQVNKSAPARLPCEDKSEIRNSKSETSTKFK